MEHLTISLRDNDGLRTCRRTQLEIDVAITDLGIPQYARVCLLQMRAWYAVLGEHLVLIAERGAFRCTMSLTSW